MACQTCDHTMQSIASKVFWCPRCGTIKREYNTLNPEWYTPKIVERSIEMCMAALHFYAPDEGPEAARLDRAETDLAECCVLPNERAN